MARSARVPSNRMPFIPREREDWISTLSFLSLLGAAVILLLYLWAGPIGLVVLPMAITAMIVFRVIDQHRHRRMMSRRAADSICSFARSFDGRRIDTWIIRAVYEELERCMGHPIRAADRLKEDLRIDWEDLDDLIGDISHRAGRSIEQTEQNPLYDKVRTVSDVVEFLAHQPRRPPSRS